MVRRSGERRLISDIYFDVAISEVAPPLRVHRDPRMTALTV
jgi:hypothetical protein